MGSLLYAAWLPASALALQLQPRKRAAEAPRVNSAAGTPAGSKYTFTIDEGANGQDGRISVNYDGFIDDVSKMQGAAPEAVAAHLVD